ncbi:helix-turn-helix domain-containing protein [Streptomyces sp. NPDC003015]
MFRPGTARLLAPLTSHDALAVLTPHPDDVPWLDPAALPRPRSRTDSSGSSGSHLTHERFLDALELHFRDLHRVEGWAQVFGCSVRTLSRATRAVVGRGAREVIDERRLLEARRLLDHARWTAHAIATPLGFTDAADFGRKNHHASPRHLR